MNQEGDKINTDPKKVSILIVDDEAANVLLLEKFLSLKGYCNVVSTQDPLQALPLYQKHNCDLILLDLDMPVLDGYGVMDQLNALTGNNPPPILVLTAQRIQSYRQRALDNGARDYVTKPFDANELLSRVRNLIDAQIAQKFMLHQNEILEQKVAERTQELLIAKNIAEKANLAKTVFLSNMSHELRTPLNGIMGFSEIMRDEVFGALGNERYKEYSSDINGAASHLLTIISDILDITHILSGTFEINKAQINLQETLDVCERLVSERAIFEKVSISIEVDPKIPMITAEKVRLQQIFLNLLTNSIKFAPNGLVKVSATLQSEYLIIKVSDDGIGISPENIEHVLNPFEKVQQDSNIANDGAGLGLYLTKALTELHGGTMSIDSTLSQGTTVSLIFPVSEICAQDITTTS